MQRINVGCGQSPIIGWRNFDNSLSLLISKIPFLPILLRNLGILEEEHYHFIEFARFNKIEYGDAAKGLPIPDGSVDVLYSSHMLEHLDRTEVDMFLKDASRMLCDGGIIRLSVPDLKKHVEQYIKSGNADAFLEATLLCAPRPKTIAQRLRVFVAGARHHQWMYDAVSLSKLLEKHGFVKSRFFQAGETNIENYEPLNLYERASESVYVEAVKRVEFRIPRNCGSDVLGQLPTREYHRTERLQPTHSVPEIVCSLPLTHRLNRAQVRRGIASQETAKPAPRNPPSALLPHERLQPVAGHLMMREG